MNNKKEEEIILKAIKVEIPFIKKNTNEIKIKITKHIPIPPTIKLENTVDYTKKIEEEDKENITQAFLEMKDRMKKSEDKQQWLARAMNRNKEILYLSERIRPLSQKDSFSTKVLKK
jgi:hypothetical protein